jgi:hypothetical protein
VTTTWRPYRSREVVLARRYDPDNPGESLKGVSIPDGETVMKGGWIVRRVGRPTSQWYVGPRAFGEAFERVE